MPLRLLSSSQWKLKILRCLLVAVVTFFSSQSLWPFRNPVVVKWCRNQLVALFGWQEKVAEKGTRFPGSCDGGDPS